MAIIKLLSPVLTPVLELGILIFVIQGFETCVNEIDVAILNSSIWLSLS